MPIYSIPPEVHGGRHHGNLHSPIGIGPRGNSVFFCSSYVDNGNDTYTAPKSSFISTRNSGMYDPRTGDLVLFRVEHDDDSSLLIGYIFSINPIGGAITFTKLAEISMSGMSAADRTKLDGITTAANRVTATEVAHYPGATSIRFGIINANDLVASNYYVPKVDNDGRIEQDAIVDGSITTAKLADGAATSLKIATAAVTGEKILDYSIPVQKLDTDATDELTGYKLYSVDATTQQTLSALGFASLVLSPELMSIATLADTRTHLCWIDATSGYVEKAPISFSGNLQAQTITIWAKGLYSKATGVQGVDDSWTITPLPTDGDEVSY